MVVVVERGDVEQEREQGRRENTARCCSPALHTPLPLSLGQGAFDPDVVDPSRSGQSTAEQDRADQNRTDQTRPDQTRPEQNRTEQNRTGRILDQTTRHRANHPSSSPHLCSPLVPPQSRPNLIYRHNSPPAPHAYTPTRPHAHTPTRPHAPLTGSLRASKYSKSLLLLTTSLTSCSSSIPLACRSSSSGIIFSSVFCTWSAIVSVAREARV